MVHQFQAIDGDVMKAYFSGNIPGKCIATHNKQVSLSDSEEGEDAMTQEPGKKSPKKPEIDPQTIEQEIRCRAYELYGQRGREEGHDLDDWLRAEEEIVQTKARSIAA